MRMQLTTLVVMALAGYGSQVNAQERCPESTRLRSETAQVIRPVTSIAPADRCGAYVRFAMAWGAERDTPTIIASPVTFPRSHSARSGNVSARPKKRATMSARAGRFAPIRPTSLSVDRPVASVDPQGRAKRISVHRSWSGYDNAARAVTALSRAG